MLKGVGQICVGESGDALHDAMDEPSFKFLFESMEDNVLDRVEALGATAADIFTMAFGSLVACRFDREKVRRRKVT